MHHSRHRLLLLAILLVCSAAHAQIAPIGSPERQKLLREATAQLLRDLEQVRRFLAPGVDTTERPIFNSVKFRVPDGDTDDTINCFAGRDPDGTRVVWVGLGFSRAVTMFTDAQLLARALNDPAKGEQYTEYIREKWQENLARGRRGLDPVIIESPQDYLHASAKLINTITTDSNRLYTGALSFAVAHEVGHHVLEDDVRDRVHSLEREKAADNWAMKTMIAAGQPPTAGIMVMTFYSSFFRADASHPNPDERMIDMVKATLANLDRFSGQARANGVSIGAYRQQLTEALQQLTEFNNPAPTNPRDSRNVGTFLGAVQKVLEDLPSRFRNILGDVERRRTSSVGPSVIYRSTVQVPLFDKCTIAVRDFRSGPDTEFSCQTDGGGRAKARQVFTTLVPQIRQVAGWGWRVTEDDASGWRAIRAGSGNERLSISLNFFDDRDPDLIFTSLSVHIRPPR